MPRVHPHDVEPASRRVCVRAQRVLTLSHAAAQSAMLCILVTTGTVARVLVELQSHVHDLVCNEVQVCVGLLEEVLPCWGLREEGGVDVLSCG